MTTFELKNWMSENRETVISKYNKLTNEANYNGIALRGFMIQVMAIMQMNNIKSEKKAFSMLPIALGEVYNNNSRIVANDNVTESLKAKYDGTAAMALV